MSSEFMAESFFPGDFCILLEVRRYRKQVQREREQGNHIMFGCGWLWIKPHTHCSTHLHSCGMWSQLIAYWAASPHQFPSVTFIGVQATASHAWGDTTNLTCFLSSITIVIFFQIISLKAPRKISLHPVQGQWNNCHWWWWRKFYRHNKVFFYNSWT